MNLRLDWRPPVPLLQSTDPRAIYTIDVKRLPSSAGVYIFGRQHGDSIEALYVGRAHNIRRRVKQQLNNLQLMSHIKHARSGERLVLVGVFKPDRNQAADRHLHLIEKALIRHFISEGGHDLVNRQGTKLRIHEVVSRGRYRRFIPASIPFSD